MKKKYPSERVAELVNEMLDAWKCIENAPQSPVFAFLPVKARREARRSAKQLRKGQLVPRYENHSPEDLATIYEVTADRDETLDRQSIRYVRAGRELQRLGKEDPEPTIRTFNAMFHEAREAAMAEGPGSEASERFRRMCFLISVGDRIESDQRRQKSSFGEYVLPYLQNPRAQARYEATAVEILNSPPAGETVFMIPAEESGRQRVLMRIGIRSAAWVGSFEPGNRRTCTVLPMPNDAHMFISAGGAGYILDAQSRTIVEKIGDDVVSAGADPSGTVFFVNHDDRILEAFCPSGRLWKTEPIGDGFRNLGIHGEVIAGEARQSSESEWVPVSIDILSGAVSWDRGRQD